jgi:hypothetical protein
MIGEHHSNRIDPFNGKSFPVIGLLKLVAGMPFIYSLIIPIGFLDLLVSLYQWVCFPIYRLSKVRRSEYIRIKRKGLESLNVVDRLNCYYCSYANGVLRYAQKIASETEKMWCPIRQKLRPGYIEPEHHAEFAENGRKEILLRYFRRYERRTETPPDQVRELPSDGREICPEYSSSGE